MASDLASPPHYQCGHAKTPENTDSYGMYKRCAICHRKNQAKYVKAKTVKVKRAAVWSNALTDVWR